jgi:hypothetical protein
LHKSKCLDSIASVSRNSKLEKYELTNRKKELGFRNTGSGNLAHGGPNDGNGFE